MTASAKSAGEVIAPPLGLSTSLAEMATVEPEPFDTGSAGEPAR
jgi:hypothetical protein